MKALLSLLLALSAGPVSAAPQTHTLPRPDGSLIHFTLDLAEGDSAGLLVLAQGSGCALAAASNSLATVRQAFPAHTALIVEKVGIVPDTAMSSDCPAEFLDHYTLSQRIDDYQQVLSHLGGTQDIILFGGSEGGLAMEALAARIPSAAAILLSGSVGGTFGEMVLSTVPPEGKSSVAAGFAEARANPNSSTVLSGHTYRFWADILDHRSSDYLEATDTPFLLIHGGRDNAPVQPVRALADRFAAEGRCNLTYWEFPALDHSMVDPAGTSQLQRIARLAAAWAEYPMPAC